MLHPRPNVQEQAPWQGQQEECRQVTDVVSEEGVCEKKRRVRYLGGCRGVGFR